MKAALIYFLCFAQAVYGGVYGDLITPNSANKLQDSAVRREIASILSGSGDFLYVYSTKYTGRSIISNYKNSNWILSAVFNSDVHKAPTPGLFKTYCPPDTPLVAKIRYFHVKYMLAFEETALVLINREIKRVFAGQPILINMKSYISRDRFRNYLDLEIEGSGKRMSVVFVIKNSMFYKCVLSTAK